MKETATRPLPEIEKIGPNSYVKRTNIQYNIENKTYTADTQKISKDEYDMIRENLYNRQLSSGSYQPML